LKTTPEKLEALLGKGLAPVYLLSGDEPLTLGESADSLRAAARAQGFTEREVFFVERANSGPWDEMFASAQSLSLFAPRRMIEIRLPGGKPGTGAKALQELIGLASADLLVLIIAGALDWESQKSAWVQAVDRAGIWVVAENVNARQFPQWLRQRAQRHALQLDDEAIATLAARTEGNLLAAVQELQKLALAGLTQVGAAEILASSAQSSRFDVSQLGEAILQGDTARALHVLSNLRSEGEEATLILWSVLQELRTLWVTLVPGAPMPGVWSRNKSLMPAAAARMRPLGRTWFAQLNRRALRADRCIKGQSPGNAWDELATLVAEFAGGSVVLRPAA
jgi:DNA polymerase III subunit delta